VRALGVGEKRRKKKRFPAHALPLNDRRRRTMANFTKIGRDLNWHSCSSTAQYMALLIRSPGNVETVLIPTAPWYVLSSNKRTSFWSKLYWPTEGTRKWHSYIHECTIDKITLQGTDIGRWLGTHDYPTTSDP
jgi:hypothetical protein